MATSLSAAPKLQARYRRIGMIAQGQRGHAMAMVETLRRTGNDWGSCQAETHFPEVL